jgi:hypothetical protein
MRAQLESLEDEFIVSVCSDAMVRRSTAADDLAVSVFSGGMVLRYESIDELVFVLINLSVSAAGAA